MNETDEIPGASNDVLQRKTSLEESDELLKDGEEAKTNDGHVRKKSLNAEDLLLDDDIEPLSSDGLDGKTGSHMLRGLNYASLHQYCIFLYTSI